MLAGFIIIVFFFERNNISRLRFNE
jgi:hypothetical protein